MLKRWFSLFSLLLVVCILAACGEPTPYVYPTLSPENQGTWEAVLRGTPYQTSAAQGQNTRSTEVAMATIPKPQSGSPTPVIVTVVIIRDVTRIVTPNNPQPLPPAPALQGQAPAPNPNPTLIIPAGPLPIPTITMPPPTLIIQAPPKPTRTLVINSAPHPQPNPKYWVPDQAVRDYYAAINNQQYDTAWGMLSDAFIARTNPPPNGYSQYLDWWTRVAHVNVLQVNTLEIQDNVARVKAQLQYQLNDGRLIADTTPYITLIWDNSRGWLFYEKK